MNRRAVIEKTGKSKYISHLDLMRCIMRSLRIANIPIEYSNGFSPHPQISFLTALPLGEESTCEILDFKTQDNNSEDDMTCISDNEIQEKLNKILPNGIKVSSVYQGERKASELAFAEYEIKFFSDNSNTMKDDFFDFYNMENINIEKTNKKRQIKIIDIKPDIKILSSQINDDGFTVNMQLPFGCSKNLNPFLVVSAFEKEKNISLMAFNIRKIKIFCEDGQEFS